MSARTLGERAVDALFDGWVNNVDKHAFATAIAAVVDAAVEDAAAGTEGATEACECDPCVAIRRLRTLLDGWEGM